ncbi:dockerin type I domain-containing protein [Anaerocolumna sp. AGMB13025]|uniref:dockerin type I domain-containing protein n=1 Tax=Anaerocolumna sp. AGMB13025 TaxID=3039116 RepID=UPI00241C8854|nr:dockerin type I domain-containing protein [Anaerocolumna sp. AGMB13025]WFR58830.1 dockerin type I domain-containing protein [Anaerocolumna sp. AGMB13025]
MKINFKRVIALVVLCVFAGVSLASNSATAAPAKIKGSEVLIIGDSFLALSHEITKRLEQNAKNAGILDSSDKFRDNSVSGTQLYGGMAPSIPDQYKNGVKAGTVKYVIMDGGGNDCLMGTGQPPYNANSPFIKNATDSVKNLLTQMGKDGVVKVFYLFYPDPQQDLGGLKGKLDVLRPLIQNEVNKSITPKAYWLDLRPVFSGKYSQYILSDGIHPTTAGSIAAADAIWAEMQKNNFFGTDVTPTPKIGDVNADNNIDTLDFTLMKQYLLGIVTDFPASDDMYAADLNGDGSINALDLALMKQYLLGIITKFPK